MLFHQCEGKDVTL